jgi:hypothetical protein
MRRLLRQRWRLMEWRLRSKRALLLLWQGVLLRLRDQLSHR